MTTPDGQIVEVMTGAIFKVISPWVAEATDKRRAIDVMESAARAALQALKANGYAVVKAHLGEKG